MSLGERIKALREKSGMTQDDLARLLGSTKQTVYKYETGIITNIPADKLELIAKALQTTPGYLIGWEPLDYSVVKAEPADKDPGLALLTGLWKRLNPKEQEKLLAIIKLSFEEYF